MAIFELEKEINLQAIALRVKNREKMIAFYKQIVGFVLKNEENNLSIFSAQPTTSRLLILEEFEEGTEKGRETVLDRFSLFVPTNEEFAGLAKRIVEAAYPVEKFYQTKDEQVLLFSDPEGNRIEAVYEKHSGFFIGEKKLSLPDYVAKNAQVAQQFSEKARISRVFLKVKSVEQSLEFYQSVLGLTLDDNYSNCVSMNNQKFSIFLEKADNFSFVQEYQLGIDFFGCILKEQKSIKLLQEHLKELDEDFYIDFKQSVLTIYDPSGIEWWFLRLMK